MGRGEPWRTGEVYKGSDDGIESKTAFFINQI
jgi:hypothetical protein